MSLIELHHGDCLSILPTLEAQSVNMVLADLPYGTTRNKWDSLLPLDALWAEYRRVLKTNGVVALTSQGAFTAKLIASNERDFKYKIVWEKSKPTNFLNAKKQPLRKHEDICIFYRGRPTYNPQMGEGGAYNKGVRKDQATGSYNGFDPVEVRSDGGRYPTDVVYFKTAESEPERTVWHGTQKPVGLMAYLIRTYTNPGDTVLDNTMGVGTTGVACLQTGRRFVGIEQDSRFFAIARQRLGLERIAA